MTDSGDATTPKSDDIEGTETAYLRSPVILTAARTVVPFVFVYGLFITLHGTGLPGGGFQGGIVMGATVVLIVLAFGVEPTRRWIDERILAGAFVLGFALFGLVAFAAVGFGGALLEVFAVPIAVVYTVEIVEFAIGILVAAVVAGLVVWIGAGAVDDGGEPP
ncbi:Na(+)/H(+) antiporter subunit B [Halorubrum luteum]